MRDNYLLIKLWNNIKWNVSEHDDIKTKLAMEAEEMSLEKSYDNDKTDSEFGKAEEIVKEY